MKLLNVKNEAEQVEWREGRYLILSIFCFALCWKVLKKYKYLWKDRFNFSSWSLKNTPIATPLHPAYGFSKPKDNRTSWKPKCLSLLKKKKKDWNDKEMNFLISQFIISAQRQSDQKKPTVNSAVCVSAKRQNPLSSCKWSRSKFVKCISA